MEEVDEMVEAISLSIATILVALRRKKEEKAKISVDKELDCHQGNTGTVPLFAKRSEEWLSTLSELSTVGPCHF